MSKLTQIEKAVHSMDGAAFQRLCDSYLYKRGYQHINTVGLVIGADKVAKGTPDTLTARTDGNYDFAEYSTQQDGLATKFAGDLASCFDETKTGIPVKRIHEIVLCHNARMTPQEQHDLTEQCRRQGVILSINGAARIAHDLYQKYPGLAKDFLGVEVDTRQILTTADFLAAYNKRSFATPLDTVFKFRDEELKKVREALEDKGLALISGRPGVGKTRFALKCCDLYLKEHPDAQVYCIFNKGADLFEDLRVYFSQPGHFLILVDDANRLSGFEYALQLLHDQGPDQKIRIIATVRDYALASVEKTARPFGGGALIELEQFKEDQIKELVRDNSAITNPLYLDRIAEIAQGNPRLAMMAARVAERENNLQSIVDVSALYDEYFASIRDDLEDLGNSSLILVAGLIAFFRVIDRSNAEMMGAITDNFRIEADEFWQAARRLHELEVVDMYENEIVRISDQVLSTYLFYLAAFRERALDFGILLARFFPNFRHRLIDALNPVLSSFDGDAIVNTLRPHVDSACEMSQQRDDEDGLMNLLDVFWFVKPTDTLIYLREKIDAMVPAAVPLSDLTFVMSNNLPPSPSVLGILDNFRYADQASMSAALSLMLDYLEKRPAELPLVLRMLQERYGMDHYSHLNRFAIEHATIDTVWGRAQNGKNELFSRLFLTIAEPLLHTHFQTSQSKGNLSIAIINFDVPVSQELIDFRKVLWQGLFSLYSSPALREEVLNVIAKHSGSGYLVANREIIESDSDQVLAFFQSSLDPATYRHCVVVQDYLDLLERVGIAVQISIRERFTDETYKLSELVLVDRRERREVGWQEYETMQRERLAAYTANFDESDFVLFFERCAEIIRTADGRPYEYQVQNGAVNALLDLAERDSQLFSVVFERYLDTGNSLKLGPWRLVEKIIRICGSEGAYEILYTRDYFQRVSWLLGYFIALPEDQTTAERLQQLYALYESAQWHEPSWGMDHLLKFVPLDKDVLIKVTRTLVNKSKTEPKFGQALNGLFTERSEVGRRLPELFASDVELLKEAYFATSEAEDHEDFDGHAFNQLLDLDPNFGEAWVSQLYQKVDRPSRRDDSRDYAFIWRRADFIRVMGQIVDAICTYGKNRLIYDSYLQNFFVLVEGTQDITDLHNRQDTFLDDVIERRSQDKDLMGLLFEVISGLGPERRKARLETFVRNNKDYEMFERLPMESNFAVYSGSDVPRLQRRIEFLESLLPMLNTVELLRHRQHIERLIQRSRTSMESEKRRDFMSDKY
jgi:hypothetical protein